MLSERMYFKWLFSEKKKKKENDMDLNVSSTRLSYYVMVGGPCQRWFLDGRCSVETRIHI